MTAQREKIISDILVQLESGKSFTDACSVICSKFQFTERTFAKYWNEANERFKALLEKRKQAWEGKTITTLEKHAERAVLTKLDKLELLENIALGKTEFEKVFFDKGVPKKVAVKPDASDRMKAVEIHNRMTGDNEAEKGELTILKEQPFFELPDINVPTNDSNK